MWFSVARLRQIFAASIAYVTLLPVVHARDEVLCECSFIILSRSSCRGKLGRMQQLGWGGRRMRGEGTFLSGTTSTHHLGGGKLALARTNKHSSGLAGTCTSECGVIVQLRQLELCDIGWVARERDGTSRLVDLIRVVSTIVDVLV